MNRFTSAASNESRSPTCASGGIRELPRTVRILALFLRTSLRLGFIAAAIAIAAYPCQATEAAGPAGPAGLAGLAAWYRADAIADTRDGDLVRRWNDSSPQRIPLGISEGEPTFVSRAIGGLPAVRFRQQ